MELRLLATPSLTIVLTVCIGRQLLFVQQHSTEVITACRQELAASIATEGLLPLQHPGTPKPFAQLLEACWKLTPAERPSAAQMVKSLQAMQADGSMQGDSVPAKDTSTVGEES